MSERWRADVTDRVGFGAGVRCFLDGLGFVVGTPRVWPWAAAPSATAFVLFASAATLGYWETDRVARSLVGTPGATTSWGADVAYTLVSVIVAFVVALVVTLALAQPLSGWALDRVVRAQEIALGLPAHPAQKVLPQMLRALGVSLLGLAVGLPVLGALQALAFFVPVVAPVVPPLQFVVGAILVAWGFLDYPLSQRGVAIGARVRFMGARFGAVLGFGIAAATLLIVPCVGLLVLPIGVAGAARLVTATERRLA
jgi:CysZ protein